MLWPEKIGKSVFPGKIRMASAAFFCRSRKILLGRIAFSLCILYALQPVPYKYFCLGQDLCPCKIVYILCYYHEAAVASLIALAACLFGSLIAKDDNAPHAKPLYAGPEKVGTDVERDAAITAFFRKSDWPEGTAPLGQVHKGQKFLQILSPLGAGIA